MTDELKPVRCGCGGEAMTDYLIGEKGEGLSWYVYCKECETETKWFDTEAEAIEAWNRAMGAKDINVPDKERTAKVKKGAYDLMRCECGMPVSSNYDYCPKCRARLEWE